MNARYVLLDKDINALAEQIYSDNREKGFFNLNTPVTFPEACAFLHSEVSEALEGYWHNNPPSEHIPGFTSIEEEFADLFIRLMCYTSMYGIRLIAAVDAKLEYNRTRPHKHGKTI